MRAGRSLALGGTAALFVLAGRWGPLRLGGAQAEDDIFLELRLWLAVAGLVLVAAGQLDRAQLPPREGEALPDPLLSGALLLFLGYMGLGAAWAPDRDFALAKLYDLTLVAVLAVGLMLAAPRLPAERLLSAFWAAVVAAGVLLSLMGLRQLLAGGVGRLSVLGGGPNVFARQTGLMSLGALYFWSQRGRPWLWIPLAALGGVMVVLSGSRGGTAAWVLGVLAFLGVQRVRLRRIAVLAALGLLAYGAALQVPVLARALQGSVEDRYVRLTLGYRHQDREHAGAESGRVYLSGRKPLFAAAYQLGKEHPVGGAGLAAFPALGLGVYPHNLFLEVFCEGGLTGLALLAWLLFTFTRVAVRRRRHLDGATAGAVVLVFAAIQASGDLFDSRALFILMSLAACTAVPHPQAPPEPAPAPRPLRPAALHPGA